MTDTAPLATLAATPGRRLFAIGATLALGVLLILAALNQPPALGWQIFLLVLGGLVLVLTDRLRRATLGRLTLTETGLWDADGTCLAAIEDIARVERGVFAFKPSNGFVLHLGAPARARVWRPGLWWRFGRRVGVGGVVPAGAAKYMADQLSMLLERRRGG